MILKIGEVFKEEDQELTFDQTEFQVFMTTPSQGTREEIKYASQYARSLWQIEF